MERKMALSIMNIKMKAVGSLVGGSLFFVHFQNFEGKPAEWAICAAYCALGYMAGNCACAALSLIGANNKCEMTDGGDKQ